VTLELDAVTAGYDGEPVVSDVSLRADPGTVTCLLGPNGAGKSTLLRCLTGLLSPLSGTVRLGGDDLASLSRREVARRVGYVPQTETDGYPATVFEAVLLGRRPHAGWQPSASDHEAVADALETLGISELAMRDVGSLSGGQRQQVALARALAQEPAALVCDEPTSDLDVRHELGALTLLCEQAAAGTAAVIAMHDLTLAARYSDRLVVLHDGEVLVQGEPSVLTPEVVETVYGVAVSVYEDESGVTIVPEHPVRG